MSGQVICRSRRSASSGNQLLISFFQSSSLIGGSPGVSPDVSAGARYSLIVLRSPSDAASSLLDRPAYQCTSISVMSTTVNVLLAIGCVHRPLNPQV